MAKNFKILRKGLEERKRFVGLDASKAQEQLMEIEAEELGARIVREACEDARKILFYKKQPCHGCHTLKEWKLETTYAPYWVCDCDDCGHYSIEWVPEPGQTPVKKSLLSRIKDYFFSLLGAKGSRRTSD